MRRLPALVTVALAALAVALAPAAYTDRASCQRANAGRQVARIYYTGLATRARERALVDVSVKRRLDVQAAAAAHAAVRQLDPLDCALPLPETR